MTIRTALARARSWLGRGARRVNRRFVSEGLLTVSGANRDILREAPKERTKQVAMGAVLVSVAAIAAVSATYALYLALHVPVDLAAIGGLAWGLVILNLDRWLVVSTPRLETKWGTIGMALPRVLLAVLIGAVVSTPLTLAVFGSEISAEIRVMAAENEDEFNRKLEADSRYSEIPAKEQEIEQLQADLADGVSEDDIAQHPVVADVQARLDDITTQYNAAVTALLCEADGTCGTGDAGMGPATAARMADRDRLGAERESLTQQLGDTQAQVRAQLEAQEAQTSIDQSQRLETLQQEVRDAEDARRDEITAHDAAVDNSDGILARLSALERIQDDDPMLATAHLLLFLFMTAIECLPIIFKTMLALAPPSLYDRLLVLHEQKAESRVRLRMQTEYEEAETLARSALAAAEARAARTLEAESKATGLVLDAQLEVTAEGMRRWRDEQLAGDVTARDVDAAGVHTEPSSRSPVPAQPVPGDVLDDLQLRTFEDNVALDLDPAENRAAGDGAFATAP
ncbi:DUF4407 domain-containing protein [Blastococcus sp. HT6-30]|uniref:DUF4407 domain-containing protein n=1 Tax=Blastococcus sp. HT6-30 TaxID=3144843 RepID=UPI00321A49FF